MGKRGPKPGTTYAKTQAKRRGRARALRQAEITAERTMLEIARLAFTDRRGVWGKDGVLKALDEWTQDEAALLEGFEVVVKNVKAGDGHLDTVHKVRLAKKDSALEILAKHFGLFKERVEHSGKVTLEDLVHASRDAAPTPK